MVDRRRLTFDPAVKTFVSFALVGTNQCVKRSHSAAGGVTRRPSLISTKTQREVETGRPSSPLTLKDECNVLLTSLREHELPPHPPPATPPPTRTAATRFRSIGFYERSGIANKGARLSVSPGLTGGQRLQIQQVTTSSH